MWESLKKAWNTVKAGTLAVGAWIGEIGSSGDLDRANNKFTRKYNQKILEYTAGDRLGSTAARIVRGGANVFNNVADTVNDIMSDTPAPTVTPTRHETRGVQEERAQAELEERQAERRGEREERHNRIRAKYGIEKPEDNTQPKKRNSPKKKPTGSWRKNAEANKEAPAVERQ